MNNFFWWIKKITLCIIGDIASIDEIEINRKLIDTDSIIFIKKFLKMKKSTNKKYVFWVFYQIYVMKSYFMMILIKIIFLKILFHLFKILILLKNF